MIAEVVDEDVYNLLNKVCTTDLQVTPLVCDTSGNEETYRWFLKNSDTYSVLDCKKMSSDYHIRKRPLHIILDNARQTIVHAMKTGRTLVLRMGDITVDFLHTFNDDCASKIDSKLIMMDHRTPYGKWSYLPRETLFSRGKLLLTENFRSSLLRRADCDDDAKVDITCNDSFSVIVTTTYPFDKLGDYLFTGDFGLPPMSSFSFFRYPSCA